MSRRLLIPCLLALPVLLAGCAGETRTPAGAAPTPAPAQRATTPTPSGDLQIAVEAFNNKDYPAALALFQSISMQPGHPDAVAANKALGVMHSRGLGTERDPAVGTRYIRQAALGGDAESQAEMARRYDFAIGVERDTAQILHWAQLASAQGNPQGHQYMGWAHHFGIGVPQDLATAIGYYEMAVAGNDPIAQNNLAVLLQKGEGVPQDINRALMLFEASANQGFPAAQIQLGLLHFQSDSVPQNLEVARYWLQKAAQGGHALGAYFYGQLLESEWQVDAARIQYRRAANAGIEQAAEALQRLENSRP